MRVTRSTAGTEERRAKVLGSSRYVGTEFSDAGIWGSYRRTELPLQSSPLLLSEESEELEEPLEGTTRHCSASVSPWHKRRTYTFFRLTASARLQRG